MTQYIDITPTARVLRVLGEIPFEPWQCIAELMDNSLDSFMDGEGNSIAEKRIIVSWSGPSVSDADSLFEVQDTGPGMDLPTLKDCVKAGYTSNDPVGHLGLFGMGFNIATARLGDKTTIYSATEQAAEWVGIEIDFAKLIRQGSFHALVVSEPKRRHDEHGTKILATRMKPGIVAQLRSQEANVRRRLERVYTSILQASDVSVMVQNKTLVAKSRCTWSPSRYVSSYSGTPTPAILTIDQAFSEAFFDTQLNRYLTPEEEVATLRLLDSAGQPPLGIVRRAKRVHGWLGIQRYADPDDYGIDFIRNGRKILIGDKSLFYFENPFTGTREVEYPPELATTVGGRIVGEIHIDHIPPNYQKSDFDRSDQSWFEMVECLRGSGPILPKKRKLLGYEGENESPLANLISAYRRPDAGTRYLMAPNSQAKEWAKAFYSGDAEYQSDDKWWTAAQEADRARADRGSEEAPPVDSGKTTTDDTGSYAPGGKPIPPLTAPAAPPARTEPSPVSEPTAASLKTHSTLISMHSGEYRYDPDRPAIRVNVWELTDGIIGHGEPGLPCIRFTDGIECDFFFNPRHPFLVSYPIGYRELLLLYLSDHFKVRDRDIAKDITSVFVGLMTSRFADTRIDQSVLIEKAHAVFDTLREKTTSLLAVREQQVIEFIHESAGDVEETMSGLIHNPSLLTKFQRREVGSIAAISAVPARALVRLVDKMPEEFFDGRVFSTPYSSIQLPDSKATERLRAEAKDRILSYLKDALWALNESQRSASNQRRKDELSRCLHSINFLDQELVD